MLSSQIHQEKRCRVSPDANQSSPKLSELTHKELVSLIAHNPENQRAWREFYDRFHSVIYNSVAKICRNEKKAELAEDITQDVYRILLKDNCRVLKNFNGEYEKAIYKWLRIISVRETIKVLKSQKTAQPFHNIEAFYESSQMSDNRPQSEACQDLIGEINHYLDSILKGKRHAKRDKLIFRLRFFAGLTPEEIAKHLDGLSVKRILGVITELKKAMQDYQRALETL